MWGFTRDFIRISCGEGPSCAFKAKKRGCRLQELLGSFWSQGGSHEQEIHCASVGSRASRLSGYHQESQGLITKVSSRPDSPQGRHRWTGLVGCQDRRGLQLPGANDCVFAMRLRLDLSWRAKPRGACGALASARLRVSSRRASLRITTPLPSKVKT